MLLLLVSSIHSVPLPQKVLISPEDVQDEFRTITMFLSKQFGERNWSLFMSAWVWRASTTVSTNVVSLFFWCFSIFLEVILNIFDYFWPLQCKSRVTLRGRDEPGGACDGVLLDVVAALELDAGRGRYDRHGHAVPPALLVSPGPGHQQQVLVLGLQTRLGRVNINNCYCIGLRVLLL